MNETLSPANTTTDIPAERNLNELWLRVILDMIEAAGIRRAVLSPGGRSATTVLAVRARPAFTDIFVSNDERTGAFTALGMIKATGESAMVVTTSGSAVANLVPALTEAHECGLPLVLITCDRPRALRDSGFGQMIDHIGTCRAFVRASVDLPDPSDDPEAFIALREQVASVLSQRLGPRPGPVQINIPFAGRFDSTEPCAISPGALREASRPAFIHPAPTRTTNDIDALISKLNLRPGMKGIIVAGAECAVPLTALADFAAKTGFPVLADTASGLRGTGLPNVLSGFDALRGWRGRAAPQAELVIRFGFAPVMPNVQDYLLAHRGPTIRVSPVPLERDYLHAEFAPLVAPSSAELDALACALGSGDEPWLADWRASAESVARVRHLVTGMLPWGELAAVRELFDCDRFDFMHIGNSMSIRHADLFYPTRANGQPVYSSRGVCGIDGTLGTFLGESFALNQSGLLVLGDLAFLHDLPALANAQRHVRPACICLINNAGGAIFDFLPLASQPDYLAAIRNPHCFNAGAVATAFGLRHTRCESREALRAALDASACHDGVMIVEVVVPPNSARDGLMSLEVALACRH
jgi:2-succinyl-5-enolpyruvyl-6-hydroxy-3-cyclohexene-1-carboxylate synthase